MKWSRAERMRENLAMLDIELLPEDLELLGQLERNESCFGVDPRTFVGSYIKSGSVLGILLADDKIEVPRRNLHSGSSFLAQICIGPVL